MERTHREGQMSVERERRERGRVRGEGGRE